MVRTITLRFTGACATCGTALPAGARARWTGRGRVHGLTCHGDAPMPVRYAAGPPKGIGYNWPNAPVRGMCEDAPCCGCCGPEGAGAM